MEPVRFQLNHTSAKRSGVGYADREFSIWVSDLTPEITEAELSKTFSTRFESVKAVKVVREDEGRTYGFVRFSDQNDQREALIHMNGFQGLGEKPIKISIAVPKPGLGSSPSSGPLEASSSSSKSSAMYGQYYEQYWADQAAWGNYAAYQGVSSSESRQPVLFASHGAGNREFQFDEEEQEGDDERIVDPNLPVNVDRLNTEYVERSQEDWDEAEKHRWLHDLDNEEGFVPNFKKKSD